MINNITKRIDIDLYSPTSYEVLNAQQGDNMTRTIEFVLYEDGNLYNIPNNITANLEGHRGDNSSFIKEGCFITENSIQVTLDSDILYACGTVEAKIVMYDLASNKILSTIPFKIHVQKNPCNKLEVEKDKKSIYDYLVDRINLAIESLKEHINDFTAHFSKSEHERFNQLSNEIIVGSDEDIPDILQNGDFYLKEYD